MEKAGSGPKKQNNSVVVSRTLDHTQAEDKLTSLKFSAKGDLLHGVSAIPLKSILQKIVKHSVKKFRLSRVTEPFVKEREKKGPTLGTTQKKANKAVQVRRT